MTKLIIFMLAIWVFIFVITSFVKAVTYLRYGWLEQGWKDDLIIYPTSLTVLVTILTTFIKVMERIWV